MWSLLNSDLSFAFRTLFRRMPRLSTSSMRDGMIVLLLCLSAIGHAVSMASYAFEDAYITFRYAWNLADGEGFVFNPGEKVLGTSTPLMTLLLAFLGRCGVDIPTAGRWIYAVALSLSGALGGWFLRRRGLPWSGALFALTTVWGTGFAWTFLGMETSLHLALILACLVAADVGSRLGTGLLLGLLCLNRYDGTAVAVVVGLYLWHVRRRPPWTEAFVASALFGAWLAFAQLYFGSVFPNTLGAKAGDTGFSDYVGHVLDWMVRAAWSPWSDLGLSTSPGARSILLVVLLTPLLGLVSRLGRRDDRALWMPLGVTLVLTVGYAVIGPPRGHMWYHLPGLYTLILTLCGAWGRLAGRVSELVPSRVVDRGGRYLAIAGLLPLIGTVLVLEATTEARAEWYLSRRNQDKIDAYRAYVRFIGENGLRDTTILTREPGFLTYHTGQYAVDAAGLVSRGIYFHGPRQRRTGFHDLIQDRRPDFVSLPVKGRRASVVLPGYVPVATGPSYEWLLMRRETYEARFDELYRQWSKEPAAPGPGASAPDFGAWRRALIDGWKGRGHFSDAGRGVGWSRDMVLEFDELVLDVVADSPSTRLELVVDDLVVFELDSFAMGRVSRLSIPTYLWKGRRGRLRVIDEDPAGAVRVDGWTPQVFGRVVEVDRSGLGFRSTADLGRRHGLHLVQGRELVSSLGRAGEVIMVTRPFVVDGDFLVMPIFDFGDSRSGVHLWADGERLLSWVGSGTGRLHWLKWDLRPLQGRQVGLQIRDGNPDPDVGLGVGSILMVGER